MRILKYIMRQTQQSIVCEERSEAVTIFQIEDDIGQIGCVVGYHNYHKRDADSEWYATSKELAEGLRDDGLIRLDKEAWDARQPMFTAPTEWTEEIQQLASGNRILCTQ